jgi:hypothetical protein
MPMNEDDQNGHFLFNHPERADNFAAAKARKAAVTVYCTYRDPCIVVSPQS